MPGVDDSSSSPSSRLLDSPDAQQLFVDVAIDMGDIQTASNLSRLKKLRIKLQSTIDNVDRNTHANSFRLEEFDPNESPMFRELIGGMHNKEFIIPKHLGGSFMHRFMPSHFRPFDPSALHLGFLWRVGKSVQTEVELLKISDVHFDFTALRVLVDTQFQKLSKTVERHNHFLGQFKELTRRTERLSTKSAQELLSDKLWKEWASTEKEQAEAFRDQSPPRLEWRQSRQKLLLIHEDKAKADAVQWAQCQLADREGRFDTLFALLLPQGSPDISAHYQLLRGEMSLALGECESRIQLHESAVNDKREAARLKQEIDRSSQQSEAPTWDQDQDLRKKRAEIWNALLIFGGKSGILVIAFMVIVVCLSFLRSSSADTVASLAFQLAGQAGQSSTDTTQVDLHDEK
jgi:hypothetical protein